MNFFFEVLKSLIGGQAPQCGAGQVGELVLGTYLFSIALALILLLISALIAKSIVSKPNGSDISKRRRWFWVLGSVPTFVFTGYSLLAGMSLNPMCKDKFMMATGISALICIVLYVLLGLLISYLFRSDEALGSWFFRKKIN